MDFNFNWLCFCSVEGKQLVLQYGFEFNSTLLSQPMASVLVYFACRILFKEKKKLNTYTSQLYKSEYLFHYISNVNAWCQKMEMLNT